MVTLVVPGLNDSVAGLRSMARHLASVDRDIPWHLNGFVPRHQMRDAQPTSPTIPMLVAQSAYAQGLRYVYVGNFTDGARGLSDTYCPQCRTPAVRRTNYTTTKCAVTDGRCDACHTAIAGVWRAATV